MWLFMATTLDPLSGCRTYIPSVPNRLRAAELLRRKGVWIAPVAIGVVLIALMALLYLGSAVDPVDHMHGLPVSLVEEGGAGGGGPTTLGATLEKGLLGSPEVTEKLAIHVESMEAAEDRMDRAASYATLVVPANADSSGEVQLLTNQRAGTTGASLASGVLLPAVEAIGQAAKTEIKVKASQYRQLPAKAALGLSAFYTSLLILMSGFIGATIVNSFLDGALGFAPTEIGPKWSMARPTLITRFQTLLAKWGMAAVLTGVFVAVFLLVAIGVLGMDAPSPVLLWLYGWFGAATVAAGTLTLFAVLGTPGQLVGLLLFVYLGLASAGGTVPVQALPGFFDAISHLDPLRQILGGVRSILYLEARADAGLAEGAIATAIGLIFWLALGTFFTRRYDSKGRDRLDPQVLAYVHEAADHYRDRPG
jgi:ABC-type polysaccharide/polyol phosphate export permease